MNKHYFLALFIIVINLWAAIVVGDEISSISRQGIALVCVGLIMYLARASEE